jgi:uncharacterized membrane protein
MSATLRLAVIPERLAGAAVHAKGARAAAAAVPRRVAGDIRKQESSFMTISVSSDLEQQHDPAAIRRLPGLGHAVLGATMIGLGLRGLILGDLASVWQRIPIAQLPGQQLLAYACALVELAAGVGLLFRPLASLASWVLTVFLLLWALLLKFPAVAANPWVEGTWLGLAEIITMVIGAWIIAITAAGEGKGSSMWLRPITGAAGLRNARIGFALSLLPIGLAHFFYPKETAAFVPQWLPWHVGWAYLTGASSIAASAAILLGPLARLAAVLETVMLAIITLLCWTPLLARVPDGASLSFQVTGLLISTAITAGAWVVADSYTGAQWHALRGQP